MVLSGFVGVKDEGNAKVVAGMAGCALPSTTDPKHGKLMFFAGADGIENAGSATTRIYEDGHVEMGTGVFGGYVKVPFKNLSEEGTDWNATTQEYTVNKNFNLITLGYPKFGGYEVWLRLPTSEDYVGSVLTLYDVPVRTRSSPSLILAIDDEDSGVLSPISLDDAGLSYFPIQRLIMHAGLLQLVAVPSITRGKCWWVESYNTMLYYEKYDY